VILPFPLNTSTISGFASLIREHLKPHDTIQAVIQAEKTSDGNSPHGVFEMSFGAPPGFGRYTLTVTGTDGNMTITSAQKPANDSDLALAKASAFGKSADEGNPVSSYYKVSIRSGSDGSKVDEFEKINSGVFAEIESFVNALSGQDDGSGEPR
jgi:hypothetical protein